MATIIDAFGYMWRFNTVGTIPRLNRWVVIPTFSILCEQTTFQNHDVCYWSFDIMWLRGILSIEVEQLNKKTNDV